MTPPHRRISAATARRYLSRHHFLAPPRSLPPGTEGILAVFERLGSVQFDPLGVAGRNHDLVLHARVRDYRPEATDRLLYEDRLLVEVHNKALNIVPASELPWYRVAWDRGRARHVDHFEIHGDMVERVLARLDAEGPLSSLDFEREPAIDWYWGPTSRVRAVLEAMWEAGLIGLAHRDGNRRYYQRTEKLYPAGLLAATIAESEQLRHKLLSRYRAHGLLGATGSAELWSGIGPRLVPGGGRAERPTRRELLAELVDLGTLVPIEIEGVRGPRFVPATELDRLAAAEADADAGDPGAGGIEAAFIAPLDPLVWDRAFLRELHGFDYVWEVYTPAARRRWGYYVLPIYAADRFIGRIEPRVDGPSDAVRVLGIWWEAGVDPLADPDVVGAVARALEAYRLFARKDRVKLGPGRAATALRRAMRATGQVRV